MSDYRFPYKDAEFILNKLVNFDQLCLDAGLEGLPVGHGLPQADEGVGGRRGPGAEGRGCGDGAQGGQECPVCSRSTHGGLLVLTERDSDSA